MGCATSKPPSFHEDYCIGAKVWQGDYVQVRVAKQPYGIDDFAVRIVDMRERATGSQANKAQLVDKADPKLAEAVAEEVALWRKVGEHDNIVLFREVYQEDWLCYMLLEHCEYTFLYVLERMSTLNEQVMARFFRDVLRALQHIHQHDIVHADVKPDSFMVNGPPYVLKLSGFEAAGAVLQKGAYKGERRGTAGTSGFQAPEMLGTKRYEFKADVWSLGVTAYVIFFGNFPYKSEENVKSGKPDIAFAPWRVSKKNTKLTDKALAFVKEVLNRYPIKRPTAEKALALPFMENADSTEVPMEEGVAQTLLPNVCGAIRAGAFGRVVEPEVDDVDHILNYYQYKHHGPITPWTRQRNLGSLLFNAMEKTKKDDKMMPDVSMVVGKMHNMQRPGGSDSSLQSVDVQAFMKRMEHGEEGNHMMSRRSSGRDSLESGRLGSMPASPTDALMEAIRQEARNGRSGTRHLTDRTRMSNMTSLYSSQKSGIESLAGSAPPSPRSPGGREGSNVGKNPPVSVL